jgi:hypothetical protein
MLRAIQSVLLLEVHQPVQLQLTPLQCASLPLDALMAEPPVKACHCVVAVDKATT